MLLGDLGATVYKLESPAGRPDAPGHAAVQRMPAREARRRRRPQAARGRRDRAPAHPRGRRRAPQHAARRRRAARASTTRPPSGSTRPSSTATRRCGATTGRAPPGPGFDQLAQSSCGLEQELGGEGNGPNWYRFGMCDQACAVQSALAVLMALYWRERTGEGQLVDTSIVNGGVQLNTDAWIGPDGWSERPRTDAAADRVRSALPAVRGERRLARARVPRRARTGARCATRGARARRRTDVGRSRRSSPRAPRRSAFDLLDGAGVPVEIAPEDARPHVVHATRPRRRRPRRRLRAPARTGASASSATSSTCRTPRAASPDRRRCSASTRARCSPSSATPTPRSRPCATAASPSGPTDAARHSAGRKR